jgi:hypothetical protein
MILSVLGLEVVLEVVGGSPQWKPLYGKDYKGASFRFLWFFGAVSKVPRAHGWRTLLKVSSVLKAALVAISGIFVYGNTVASLDVLAVLVVSGVVASLTA